LVIEKLFVAFILLLAQHLPWLACRLIHNTERPHQGIGNNVIEGDFSLTTGDIEVKKRLGGMLKSYYCKAA